MNGYIRALEGKPAALLEQLTEQGVFPPGGTWWFAWREDEISLPRPMPEGDNPVDDRWDVARVFSDKAELRVARVSERHRAWLLAEDEQFAALKLDGPTEKFEAVRGWHRIMWGGDLTIGGNALHGVVRFPRPLDYGMSVGSGQRVVADVVLYLDDSGAVRTARYCALRTAREGDIKTARLPRTHAASEGKP